MMTSMRLGGLLLWAFWQLPQPGVLLAVNAGNPILFVTQVPIPADFTTIASVFGNHRGAVDSAPRGGDVWIRYPDGSLKSLTAAAGFGADGFQGANSIAVRDPAVHWSGTKALFSMVIGAPTRQYQVATFFWQIYEITGLGQNETPVVTKVPNQPADFNNVSPIYGTDDRILFTTDRPRTGELHLYPQLDEYEEAPTNTGLWSLDPTTGDLFLLNHTPSGAFTPSIDSFGRVVFVRWDHLQRDQQADADSPQGGAWAYGDYGTFNYSDETANAQRLADRAEVFPEPRSSRKDLLAGTNLEGNSINHFFPWQINEDGTEEETLNHIGRHELHGYFNRSFNDDPRVGEFLGFSPGRSNTNSILNFLQIKEDPARPGIYLGIDAPEFYTHAAGQIISLNGAPTLNANQMAVTYLTHRDTSSYRANAGAQHSGHYRDPLPLADGTLIVAHTAETDLDRNTGTRAQPGSRYDFRLKTLKLTGQYYSADQPLTAGITKSVNWWDPDVKVSYTGPLWELQPVEVRPRPRPSRRTPHLEQPELKVFTRAGVEVSQLQAFMRQKHLALVVSRNVTTRDANDQQQPYNLRIAGTATQSTGSSGKIYDVAYMQFFQADQLRGIGGVTQPRNGRRVLAQLLHDPAAINPAAPSSPAASVALGSDGSMAAFVPARRAMSWQLTDSAGTGVVRERYWLTFQPGEVRTCTSCHGLNEKDQAGRPTPTNEPEALYSLLQFWKSNLAPPATPGLRISRHAGPQLKLSWPTSAASLKLEAATDLSLPDWTPVIYSPAALDSEIYLLIEPGSGSKFYRLR